MHVVDIGGGKGLLAEHVARELGGSVHVSLVDLQSELVERAAARARRSKRRVPNLRFHAGDAGALLASGELPPADVFMGLHACGGLSDLILAHAVASGAGFCVCTCCFMSNRQIPLPRPSLRREAVTGRGDSTGRGGAANEAPEDGRAAADGERGWGDALISRDEWLGVAPAEVGALLKVAEMQSSPESARRAAHTVNALRAASAERSWAARWGVAAPTAGESRSPRPHDQACARELQVEIKCFEKKFSPRNFVLVGQPVWDAAA